MGKQYFLHYYPERIAWIGAALLGGLFLLALPFFIYAPSPFTSLSKEIEKEGEKVPLQFSLGLAAEGPTFLAPDLQSEMSLSFDPPHPTRRAGEQRLLVQLKKSGEIKRVTLPCRVDLYIHKNKLHFAKEPSSFWLELRGESNQQIEGKSYIVDLEGGKKEGEILSFAVQECPLQDHHAFQEGSPFRLLAEARWWGRDQFRQQYELTSLGERVEVGNEAIEISESDWLVWNGQNWKKVAEPSGELVVAHIQSLSSKGITFEGWDQEGYVRIFLSLAASPPFKIRGEDLFSAIRIRSEKQISCMLEKQCMVLKIGDWVLNGNGRWKILRKKDEKEAYLNGKLGGELFVLEQIHLKQGQKVMQGRLFNPNRTQSIVIEMAAQSPRKGKEALRKGKAP